MRESRKPPSFIRKPRRLILRGFFVFGGIGVIRVFGIIGVIGKFGVIRIIGKFGVIREIGIIIVFIFHYSFSF